MFRSDAVSSHRNRLSGDVAVPVAWQSIGFLIFIGVAAGVLFLSVASYSRVETVTGTITPDTGVSSIVPTRAGVIVSLAVRDGQSVAAGAELATIRAEEDGAAAQSPAALVQSAIDRQDASLAAQSDAALNKVEVDHPIPLIYYYRSLKFAGKDITDIAAHGLERALQLAPYDKNVRWQLTQQLISEEKYAAAYRTLLPLANDPHNRGEDNPATALLAQIKQKWEEKAKASATDASAS